VLEISNNIQFITLALIATSDYPIFKTINRICGTRASVI
jgi:hypothetical protein